MPAKHDVVVTWGSDGGAPYVSGVPVGRVTAVFSSIRETSQRAVIEPFVDFGALDLVGVVVPVGHPQRPGRDRGRREPAMTMLVRGLVALAAVVVALVLQVTVFPHVAWQGIVPNLVLLVVVAAALTRGAAVRGGARLRRRRRARPRAARRPRRRPVGARAGPGRLRRRAGAPGASSPPPTAVVATVAGVLVRRHLGLRATGVLLGDPAFDVAGLLQVVLVAVLWDVLLTPFVLPPLMGMFRRLEPDSGSSLSGIDGGADAPTPAAGCGWS